MSYIQNPDPDMYPRPGDGIAGADLSGDPLMSLEPEAVKVRETVRILALHLLNATLVGNPAPVVERMSKWMRNPRPGDLVTEDSTAYRDAHQLRDPPSTWPYSRMGYLIVTRDEWAETDEEHEKHLVAEREIDPDYNERLVDKATYIQYGPDPGDVCRWYNCSFLAIPTELHQFDDRSIAIPGPDGRNGITRASLIDGLADSGFEFQMPSPTDV